MFCQQLIPSVPLAMCLRLDNGGRRMAADCWNAPQWNQLLHVDCVHHGTFERARLIQFGTAGTPLKRSYPFDCLYFWALSFSPLLLLLLRPHCKSGCSTLMTLVTLTSSVWLRWYWQRQNICLNSVSARIQKLVVLPLGAASLSCINVRNS